MVFLSKLLVDPSYDSLLVDATSSDDESVEGEDVPAVLLMDDSTGWSAKGLSLKALLRHYAKYTNQKNSYITYLLRLLITHRPAPDYDSLPTTGEQLLKLEGSDFPPITSDTLPALEDDHDGDLQESSSVTGEFKLIQNRLKLKFVSISIVFISDIKKCREKSENAS